MCVLYPYIFFGEVYVQILCLSFKSLYLFGYNLYVSPNQLCDLKVFSPN